jgi:hypothetical protein
MANTNTHFRVVNFKAEEFNPEPKVNKKFSGTTWGKDNSYSKFLKRLYNEEGSPIHRRSIDKKIRFIAGNGIQLSAEISIKRFEKEVKLIAKNYEIFNCYAIIVGYNRIGELSTFKAVNIEDLAFYTNPDDNEKGFWISKDFKKWNKDEYTPEFYPIFDPQVRDRKSIYFYSDTEIDWKAPEFPTPVYNNGIPWIRQNVKGGNYHLDNLVSGFAGSFLINFPTGIPEPEEQDENFKDFMDNYTGETAQKVIMTYTEPEGEQPTISAIPTDGNDDKFLDTLEYADIVAVDAHQLPIPMMILHGQSLGGTDERHQLMEEFQIDYVAPRQDDIEFGLNEIFNTVGVTIKLTSYMNNLDNKKILEEDEK